MAAEEVVTQRDEAPGNPLLDQAAHCIRLLGHLTRRVEQIGIDVSARGAAEGMAEARVIGAFVGEAVRRAGLLDSLLPRPPGTGQARPERPAPFGPGNGYLFALMQRGIAVSVLLLPGARLAGLQALRRRALVGVLGTVASVGVLSTMPFAPQRRQGLAGMESDDHQAVFEVIRRSLGLVRSAIEGTGRALPRWCRPPLAAESARETGSFGVTDLEDWEWMVEAVAEGTEPQLQNAIALLAEYEELEDGPGDALNAFWMKVDDHLDAAELSERSYTAFGSLVALKQRLGGPPQG